jgi:hypothetical protein
MLKGTRGQSWFFRVDAVHLLAMALLFVVAIQNIINHWSQPIPPVGDYIMVIVSGVGLALFVWGFYAQRS